MEKKTHGKVKKYDDLESFIEKKKIQNNALKKIIEKIKDQKQSTKK